MKIEEALAAVRSGEKRKFTQTVDLIVNLKNIDIKKPENKVSKEIVLPHGRGKGVEVGIISDSLPDAIRKNEVEAMANNKKLAKQLSKRYEFFLCEAPLMPLVGRSLGRYLGPRGKMPKPIPPGRDPKPFVEMAKKSARVRIANAPTIQIPVGVETMGDEELHANITAAMDEVRKSLPGKAQIKNVSLKLTMGKPVRLDI